ncbi:unnamed protein product [Staurois parvus]|uniref:Uncharacterized protein n=1 Tax=Staurois parvus TaxID=386267 RepID=A0ABN9BHR1_9NEOB|nr:unnamed protein product [Staurois parvus]
MSQVCSRRRNDDPSLVLVEGIMPHQWCLWEKQCPIIGGRRMNSAPSLVLMIGKCPIIGISGRNSAPSLVSVGGIVPHHWYQWEE